MAMLWRTSATTHARCKPISATRISSTPCAIQSCHLLGSRISGGDYRPRWSDYHTLSCQYQITDSRSPPRARLSDRFVSTSGGFDGGLKNFLRFCVGGNLRAGKPLTAPGVSFPDPSLCFLGTHARHRQPPCHQCGCRRHQRRSDLRRDRAAPRRACCAGNH